MSKDFRGARTGARSKELEEFLGAKFDCPHALTDSSLHIPIRENTPELSTPLPIHLLRIVVLLSILFNRPDVVFSGCSKFVGVS